MIPEMSAELQARIADQEAITEEIVAVRARIKALPWWRFMQRERLERRVDALWRTSEVAYHLAMFQARWDERLRCPPDSVDSRGGAP